MNIIEEWNFVDQKDDREVKAKYQENPPNVWIWHTHCTEMWFGIRRAETLVDGEAGKRTELILAIYKSALEGGLCACL